MGKVEMPPFTSEEQEDPWQDAIDQAIVPERLDEAATLRSIEDPGPGATDRGSGPAIRAWPLDPPYPTEPKQLDRIENMLIKILEEGIPTRLTVRKVSWGNAVPVDLKPDDG